MPELPAGTVTFVFSDIEGSTRLLRELGEGYAGALDAHRALLRDAFRSRGGVEVDTQGDAFFSAFADAREAVAAATAAQRALEAGPVRVRMGLHTGRPERTDEGYVGLDVHLGARIAAAGHGGQVVLSRATYELLDGVPCRDLGEHRLKDFDEPAWIFQLGDEVFPPLKTIANTNLPRPASSFVGRDAEIGEVASRLRNGTRLLTLTGPGGSGKTRLAIESAAELVGDFRAGVFWVGLAPLRDPALVLPTVGHAVGAQGPLDVHIGDREQLLLLDNLEQVIAAAPQLGELVEACPNLRLLVTSRELLRVRGEVEYEVLPLANSEAVALFCDRAQLEAGAAVEELCRRLDDMPLAVELAAARAKLLTPEQIVERLGQRLDVLKGGRDADPRQATLRATIEWSHDLLDGDEQRLFARLSVFPGCTLEAAEAVCDADLDVLQSLVEKSLVRRTGERFWMLQTIREYAGERLAASGEADEIGRRHAEYFRVVAESTCLATERVEAGAMRYDLARTEQDNFRAALDWAQEHDPELGLVIAVELEQFWVSSDPFEAVRRFAALLERAGPLPPELEARVARVYGGTSTVAGDAEQGRRLHERSLALYEELGDEFGVVHLRHRVAVSDINGGDLPGAKMVLEDNVVRARELGSTFLEAEALGALGSIEYGLGNVESAIELMRRHVELSNQLGFLWFVAVGLVNLAEYGLELGDLEEAERAGRECAAVCRAIGDVRVGAAALGTLAAVARRRGDARRAGTLWGAVESERDRGSLGWNEEDIGELGDLVLAGGGEELEAARAAGRKLSLEQAFDVAVGQRDAT
jgi:predicted ATPase